VGACQLAKIKSIKMSCKERPRPGAGSVELDLSVLHPLLSGLKSDYSPGLPVNEDLGWTNSRCDLPQVAYGFVESGMPVILPVASSASPGSILKFYRPNEPRHTSTVSGNARHK
jgi:hypothetical protein